VIFDQVAWDEDLRELNAPTRRLAETTRRALERDGLRLGAPDLYRCDDEARDGTRLGGCVKHYADQLRLIFTIDRDRAGDLRLVCFAVGEGHPADRRRLSAYQRAHARRNAR
jgi:hypothetical protein